MKWHHSLYWRIALGFVGCLALLLVVQGMLFVWVVSQSGSTIPNQPPDRFAQTIALDVSQAIERDATLDIGAYVRQEYARDAQPFFVVLADGRTIEIGGSFPENMVREARTRLEMIGRGEPFPRGGPLPPVEPPFARGRPFDGVNSPGQGRPLDPGNGPGQARPFGRADGSAQGGPFGRGNNAPQGGPFGRGDGTGRGGRGPGFRPSRPAPIIASGRVVALVVVPSQPPFTFLLLRYAPTLAGVAGATLIIGAVLAAFVIFGPTRKRLRAVEDAARRLGSGDLSARAPTGGGDEVAAVAAAFNRMAADLSARAEALAASDRARRQLLADVSHELTTPVTAMRGYLETLSMPELGLDEATRARYLTVIGDETGRLERIIGDLLDLARLEGDGRALVVDEVPVAQLFGRVIERHERASSEARVTMKSDVEAGAEIVRGDRDRLEQALQNLAANALRYAPSGSAITLGAKRAGHAVVLTVTDEGAGIAPEHLPHVFDRFYKADVSRAVRQGAGPSGGSGLGLSIVKAIVERHGGTATVRSAPGRTIFELALPLRTKLEAAANLVEG